VTAGDLDTGARIGRYVIIERVGTGAMGVVYGAYDPELDRKVALKLIKPGQGKDTARARLLREAKAIARLQHPNVVAVHDVGVFEDQVFLAMEFVAGGTIKSWLAEKQRSWREILDVFIAAGRGLAAAHAAGLVHRDFKPDNVLLDKEGRPRVVDFGIARQAGGADDELAGESGDVDGTATLRDSSGKHALATVTKTGTWVGTPAYMAPEQFLGERGDEKSDQFSFCVALYEALYGERPFAGDDMLSISVNVTTEQLRPLPKDRGVPAWVRRVIMRGLKVDAAGRWDSMAALIAALSTDPAAKLRNGFIFGGVTAIVVTGLVVGWQMTSRRRADTEREIARNVTEASRSMNAAQASSAAARALRARAFAAFDSMKKEEGETLWSQTRALLHSIDSNYDQAERSLEAAYALDRSHREHRAQLADVRYEHLLFAEDFRLGNKADLIGERLTSVDTDGSKLKALAAPGVLIFSTTPATTEIVLERDQRDPTSGRRAAATVGAVKVNSPTSLVPGSYRVAISGPGLARILYPFEIRRGEQLKVDLVIPRAADLPEGFVYVAPGESWFGDGDEQLRRQFLGTVPIHRRSSNAFLIAQRETTYREWIDFLNSLPEAERARYEPEVATTSHGSLRLRNLENRWQLTFEPTTTRYVARAGELLTYAGRKRRARQDWLRFPVAGISPQDAERYLKWLRDSHRVPGARMCTELEWERAARGADDRLFPHGDELDTDDANFDATYGRVASAYGPDAVGSHPVSRSPFDVDDLAGNVLEFTTSSMTSGETAIRGGAYYFNAISSRSTNREPFPATFRDVTTGIRVCASTQEGQ
jgi:serine/threonine protein kinase/formylglycine-generating enzyme required for sulfatase activity